MSERASPYQTITIDKKISSLPSDKVLDEAAAKTAAREELKQLGYSSWAAETPEPQTHTDVLWGLLIAVGFLGAVSIVFWKFCVRTRLRVMTIFWRRILAGGVIWAVGVMLYAFFFHGYSHYTIDEDVLYFAKLTIIPPFFVFFSCWLFSKASAN